MAEQETPRSTPLHKAILFKIVKKVKILLPLVNVNQLDEKGDTAFILACEKGNKEIIDLFLNHDGVDFSIPGNKGYAAIHCLSLRGNLRVIEKIVTKANLDVNVETETKDTPLILAAKKGHVDLIQYFVAKGADINHGNTKEFTALIYACNNGHYDAARTLLELGADVNTRADYDETPLMKASQWGYVDICKLLIENGAHINSKTRLKWTALSFASRWGKVEVAKLLLENGADVNHSHPSKRYPIHTPLSFACFAEQPELIKLFLKYSADVNYPGRYSLALMACAKNGNLECAELLLSAGANCRGRNDKGETAVTVARRHGHGNMVELLLQRYGG